VFPDSYLSCWQTFHTFYEPRHLFTNPGSIVDKQAKTLYFGHLRVGNDLCIKKKLAFGEMLAQSRHKKRLHEELTRDIHDGDDNRSNSSEEEDN
jgi:hypothetical protein